ncbi:M23 family metallopeptidase [Umezawaea beigongshangensis]|uniref:M23 family metallopeptidase n=1 Tax=Umezawaea beigongshangensis TaxID=2780383 RepID=UPI0027DE3096|nr:M23 family metallopeptidase [Umezawaea beigongshangensis]
MAAGAVVTATGSAGGSTDFRSGTPLAGGVELSAALSSATVRAVSSGPVNDGGVQTVHVVHPGFEAARLVHAEQLYAQQHYTQALKIAQDRYAARQKAAEEKAAVEAAVQREAQEAAQQVEREAAATAEAAVATEQAAVAQPVAEVARPTAVKPAEGSFTSGFGARWGTTHYGVDIANSIGTPILSVMDGVVVEAGPASGFGLWVRVQHDDGTITIYGHVNETTVQQGQRVQAGQQIATMGNRGQSTGPHLHFEVWLNGSEKIDPVGWLSARGIAL